MGPSMYLLRISYRGEGGSEKTNFCLFSNPVFLVIKSLIRGVSNVLFWIHCTLKQNIWDTLYHVRDLGRGFEWLEILGFNKQKGEGGKKTAQKCDYVIHGWSLYICTHHRHHIRDHKRLYESSPRSSGVWWSGTIILLVAPPPFRKSKPKNGMYFVTKIVLTYCEKKLF